jgi:hypothetical protein
MTAPTRIAVLGFVTLAFGAAVPVRADDEASPPDPWTPEQGARILQRLASREPFLGSREAARHPESLNRFFGADEYRRLRGNPVYGYWADDGFRWVGARVAWDGVRAGSATARPIRRRAWDAAFAYVAKAHGLTIDHRAPVRIRGVCIAAVVEPSVGDPNRGVVLELRIESPRGRFWYRFGMGKPTLEDAIGASLDWAVGFARTINRDAPRAGTVP